MKRVTIGAVLVALLALSACGKTDTGGTDVQKQADYDSCVVAMAHVYRTIDGYTPKQAKHWARIECKSGDYLQ